MVSSSLFVCRVVTSLNMVIRFLRLLFIVPTPTGFYCLILSRCLFSSCCSHGVLFSVLCRGVKASLFLWVSVHRVSLLKAYRASAAALAGPPREEEKKTVPRIKSFTISKHAEITSSVNSVVREHGIQFVVTQGMIKGRRWRLSSEEEKRKLYSKKEFSKFSRTHKKCVCSA